MSNVRLLPVGSSPLEVAAARACAEIEKIPIPLRRLWNPDNCPVNLLPWLAWAYSVDRWDSEWPEETKREVVRASELYPLSIPELITWREKALQRSGNTNE